MNFPAYSFTRFQEVDEAIFYAFTSSSPEKAIQKLVIFTPIHENQYNVALVDLLTSGELSDTAVSSNQDMEQVLATVIQIILHFLRDRPATSVVFKGSTPSRTRLYRAIIGKYLTEIAGLCTMQGITVDDQVEVFQLNQNYAAFVVSLL